MLKKARSKYHFWYHPVSFNYPEKTVQGRASLTKMPVTGTDRQTDIPSIVFCGGYFFDYAEQVDRFLLNYLLDLLKIKMAKPSFPLCIGDQVKETTTGRQLDRCKTQCWKGLLWEQLPDLHEAASHFSWWPLGSELPYRSKSWGAIKSWMCLQLSRAAEPPCSKVVFQTSLPL